MSDKSLNSLLGPLATKELPASGRLRTNKNSIDEYHDKESFHSKLMNSMEEAERSTRRDSKDIPSETNSMKSILKSPMNKLDIHIRIKFNEEHTQKSEKLDTRDIPSELNSMMDTQASTEQTATDIPTESTSVKVSDDINHMVNLLSLGLKTNQPGSTDGDQTQLNPVVNKGMNEDEITNVIINKISNQKTSTAQKVISTLPENNLLNNQDLKPPGEAISNIAQKQTGDLIPEHAATLSGKLITTQVTTNTTQQIQDMEQDSYKLLSQIN